MTALEREDRPQKAAEALLRICDSSNWPEDAQSGVGFRLYTEITDQLHEIADDLLAALPVNAKEDDMAASPLAKRIAKTILDDVTERRGWRQTWDQFDDDIKREIMREWHKLIDAALAQDKR
jgi:hypothetical protein